MLFRSAGLFLVEVSNQAPTVGAVQFGGTTVAAGGTVSVNEGTPLLVSGVFADPGLLDVHTVRMDWGDGTKSVVTLPVGDRVFGHWNKIPFVGTVGNDRYINDITGPEITVHLELPIKYKDKVHNILIVKHKDIKAYK